jgi:hypothetical protein
VSEQVEQAKWTFTTGDGAPQREARGCTGALSNKKLLSIAFSIKEEGKIGEQYPLRKHCTGNHS